MRASAALGKATQGLFALVGTSLAGKVMEMTCGLLPKGFDVDKELEQMWEERAK